MADTERTLVKDHKPSVVEAWAAVMGEVQGIGKGERNQQQNFSFRGIDTVMNAVGPALRKHGVVVTPYPEEITTSTYQTRNGTTMFNAIVKMRYTVRGPGGDSFDGGALGEAADAGDKAVSKAQSVAYRVFLLQSLTVPTDEPDPDHDTHQRAAPQINELDAALRQLDDNERSQLRAWTEEAGLSPRSSLDAAGEKRVLAHIKEMVGA